MFVLNTNSEQTQLLMTTVLQLGQRMLASKQDYIQAIMEGSQLLK